MRMRRLDLITLLILGFTLILGFLYYQLSRIDSYTSAYHEYHALNERLLLNDSAIDKTFEQKLNFINYDDLNVKVQNIEHYLQQIEATRIAYGFRDDIAPLLDIVKEHFKAKVTLVEDFKSTNAAVINSIHYLFDLQRALFDNRSIGDKSHYLINDILFSVTQLLIHLEIDTSRLEKQIAQLQQLAGEIQHIDYYVSHSRLAIQKIVRLNSLLKDAATLPFRQSVMDLDSQLQKNYEKHRSMQKQIITLIFFSSLLFILLLLLSYRRYKKTFSELAAFRFAVAHSDNSVVMTDTQRRITYVNDIFEKGTGYTREEVLGQNPSVLKSGLMDAAFYADLNATIDRGEKWEGEFINKRKDGSLFYEKASIVPIYVDDVLVNYLAIKLDITDYIEQKKQLQLSAAVFEHTDEGIIITDADQRIISVNKAFLKLTGYSEEELLGQTPNILKSGKQDDSFYDEMWKSINEEGLWKGKIYDVNKAGRFMPTWLTVSAITDNLGNVVNYVAIHTDLQEVISSQKQIEFLAHHDSLTGLPNRRRFEEHLTHVLQVAKRNQTTIAILFIDLDRFKVINDTLGHHVGDSMLKVIASRIKQVVRESDILARIGGDEFVVILETVHNQSDPAHVSEKILNVVKEPIEIDGHLLNTTASIGIALFPEDGEDMNTLIKHADSAMYHAKDKGKNNYQYFTSNLSNSIHQRLEIEQAMRMAVKNREFALHFQPKYDLHTREVLGAEALIRWEHPSLGFIPPDRFIPIAEETGMIIPIGNQVFEEACRAFMSWRANGLELETIAINVSSIQIARSDLLDTFVQIMSETGIEATNIEIEITERYILEYTTSNLTVLDDFRNLGFKIAIDDFGTGYSSMSYLKQLPLDTIKIDKSFIDEIPGDANDIEITKAILALSSSLGYDNIAEGIETEAQEEFLKAHGCQIGQGYLFQRPVPNEEFIRFCQNNRAVLQ